MQIGGVSGYVYSGQTSRTSNIGKAESISKINQTNEEENNTKSEYTIMSDMADYIPNFLDERGKQIWENLEGEMNDFAKQAIGVYIHMNIRDQFEEKYGRLPDNKNEEDRKIFGEMLSSGKYEPSLGIAKMSNDINRVSFISIIEGFAISERDGANKGNSFSKFMELYESGYKPLNEKG